MRISIFLTSALRGWRRSGERARLRRGDPAELGSADFGREKDFLLGVRLEPGEYVCVVLEEPGWWPMGRASGEGERVGETGRGEGDGVRARGERGMWPTDLRRLGEWRFLVLMWSLCFRPWREEGRVEVEALAGEHGAEESSEGEERGESGMGEEE